MMEAFGKERRLDEEVIKVLEEHLTVHREVVETGKVTIQKRVKQENVTVDIPIFNETYTVEHLPGSDTILDTPPPAVRNEGDKMIIPVLKEISVVVKKFQVVEEIHITRNVTATPLTQEVTLRKEEVTVEKK